MAIKQKTAVLKIQSISFIASVFTTYALGIFQNIFLKGDCYSFFAIGSCDSNSLITFAFRLYILLIFSISFSHFAFIKWSRFYYFILIVPIVSFGASDYQFAPIVFIVLLIGVLLGVFYRQAMLKFKKNHKVR